MRRIVFVGVGGVGTALLPFLSRYLNYHDEPWQLILVDGDQVESGNLKRQNFQTFGNKAEIKARNVQEEFKNLVTRAIPEYVTAENIEETIFDGDYVLMCVDSHVVRKLVSDFCGELEDVVLISGGNEFTDGNVQVFIREGGQNITVPLTRYHKEIREPMDKNPGDLTCEERAMLPGGQQTIVANMGVAWLMFVNFYLLDEGRQDKVGEHFFDVMEGCVQLIERKEVKGEQRQTD